MRDELQVNVPQSETLSLTRAPYYRLRLKGSLPVIRCALSIGWRAGSDGLQELEACSLLQESAYTPLPPPRSPPPPPPPPPPVPLGSGPAAGHAESTISPGGGLGLIRTTSRRGSNVCPKKKKGSIHPEYTHECVNQSAVFSIITKPCTQY